MSRSVWQSAVCGLVPSITLLFALAQPLVARADTQFAFSLTAGAHTASGILSAADLGNGSFLIDGVTGTLDGLAISLLPQIVAPANEQIPGFPVQFASANWIFDDVLTPGASTPLDLTGLGLQTSATTFNLIGVTAADAPAGVSPGFYYGDDQIVASNPGSTAFSGSYIPATFSASVVAVPEPAEVALLACGLLLIAALRRAASGRVLAV